MATTVEDIARHVAGLASLDIDVQLVGNWVSTRWAECAASSTLRILRRVGELVIPAPYDTGTVTITRGSKTVTGVGTTFAEEHVGRHFRARTSWYEIDQFTSATTLQLKSEFAEDDVSASGYTIVQRRHEVTPDARHLGTFVHMRRRRPLQVSSLEGLDRADSSRFSINSYPRYVAEIEASPSFGRRVEIYPFSSTSEIIHYIYWSDPPQLGFKSYIPGLANDEALREGVLADVYRHLMFKALDAGSVEKAAFLRNEFRAQETRWLSVHRTRVISQDEGLDDDEFILERRPAHPYDENYDIRTARDHVWAT